MLEWLKDFFTVKDFFGQVVTGAATGLLNVAAQGETPSDVTGWVLAGASAILGYSAKGKTIKQAMEKR